MTEQYNAGAIEVLNGLEPVRRRARMYTDTTRPNHLGREVIDNSVDEALTGYASKIQVILHADQSLEVIDDGRGMPVDIHPEEKVSGWSLFCANCTPVVSSPTNLPIWRWLARGGYFGGECAPNG